MSDRHPHAWPDAKPTGWQDLGYLMTAPKCWRLVDLEQTRYNNESLPAGAADMNTPSVVGPVYRTRALLLADLPRYTRDYFGATATAQESDDA